MMIKTLLRCFCVTGQKAVGEVLVPEHPVRAFWCCCWKRGRDLWVLFHFVCWLWVFCGLWLVFLLFFFNNWSNLDWKFIYTYCLAADNWLSFLLVRSIWLVPAGSNMAVEIRTTQWCLRCNAFKEKNENNCWVFYAHVIRDNKVGY